MVVECLFKFKVYEILRQLENGPLLLTYLSKKVDGNSRYVYSCVERLEFLGLVETWYEPNHPYRKIVSITRKGKRFLNKLKEADRVLKRGW